MSKVSTKSLERINNRKKMPSLISPADLLRNNHPWHTDRRGYWIKGIDNGYLNVSPLAALTLAIMMQITLNVPSKAMIGIPIIIKHNGMASTI